MGFGVILFSGLYMVFYHCPDYYCFAQRPSYTIAPPPAPKQIDINFANFDTIQHDQNFEFNINGSDVMVFLHIQKTGGTTFGKHLVQDIDLESPCLCKRRRKREKRKLKCDCFRPTSKTNWLFSRYSTGWKCGLH